MAFWNTQNKRWLTTAAMLLSGWYLMSMSLTGIPKVPDMLTKTLFGSMSVMTIAGIYLLFSIYLLWDTQLNG